MRLRSLSARLFIAGSAMVLLLNGCAMYDKYFGMEEDKSPSMLMDEAMSSFERGRYTDATEAFQTLKDRYPYSKFAVEAELRMADSLYHRELYDEAFDAYDEFEMLHPKNPNIPYVIYQKGMCHFEQVSTIDRDQSHTQKAKTEFERLTDKFPRSEHARKAQTKIRQCYVNLAEYELYVADFYYKKKEYRAALDRYRYLIEHYPDMGQYHKALEFIAKCTQCLAVDEEEQPEDAPDKSWWRSIIPFF